MEREAECQTDGLIWGGGGLMVDGGVTGFGNLVLSTKRNKIIVTGYNLN